MTPAARVRLGAYDHPVRRWVKAGLVVGALVAAGWVWADRVTYVDWPNKP